MWHGLPLAMTFFGATLQEAVVAQRRLTLDPPENPCHRDTIVVPDAPLREADVMWAKRVWRLIDAREKANLSLAGIRGSQDGCYALWDVITAALREGLLKAYDPGPQGHDDGFTQEFTSTQVIRLLNALDSAGAPLYTAATITRYQIKEDWIFDKQRSVLRAYIIGIAPMREIRGSDGELRGYAPLFWLYYPRCRPLFAEWLVPNSGNDKARPSFEALFRSRHFTSQVVRVSEITGDPRRRTLIGIDAQLEGARLDQELRKFEQDLWHY
jgi:gliding motility associated protien GldN